MQLGVGKTLFPGWASSLTLVKDHGQSAVGFATAAVKADTGAARLDYAVRALTSFDHAIDNTRALPVSWFVRRAPMYYRGYEAAKQAVTLLVASGLVPGARQHVGRQTLAAAKETFLTGVETARSDASRYGVHLASGWLEATAEDALTGALMLDKTSTTGRALLASVAQVRAAVARKQGVDDVLVHTVSDLFDRATSELDAAIAAAPFARAASGADQQRAFVRSGELLVQAEAAARALVADAPDDSVFDHMPVAG
ncbi:MAG: hypothetical protein JWM98_530 [Thermoleophilia bacterium]|nr:hypothetical protein [Thermoleophilia bacterium]